MVTVTGGGSGVGSRESEGLSDSAPAPPSSRLRRTSTGS